MKYNSKTPKDLIEKYVTHIDSRWGQLSDLLLTVVTDGIKYLFYINAGGCVAMITFIGTADSVRQQNWPWVVLGLFFTGLVFVGFLNIARFLTIDSLFKGWQKDVDTFYQGNLDFTDMCNSDDSRVKKTEWILYLAYVAFACFIAGGVVGFYNYQQLVTKNPQEVKKVNLKIEVKEKPKMEINTKSIKPISSSSDDLQKNHIPMKSPVPPTPQPPKQ